MDAHCQYKIPDSDKLVEFAGGGSSGKIAADATSCCLDVVFSVS